MFKKTWSLLVLTALGSMVFANVDLRTNIQDIYYRGTCEEAGSITMSVNGDDFFEASTMTPVYIRIRLNQGAALCDTLVDFSGIDSFGFAHTNVPVYLAMRLEGLTGTGTTVVAPPETVSIVRWIGGESEIWLRVQTPSNQWLNDGAANLAPNTERRVAWTFGVTARNSYNRNLAPSLVSEANLPANTTDVVNIFGNPTGFAVSTLICVDVSESILEARPLNGSDLDFDTISFDSQTTDPRTVEFSSQIDTGDQTSANFSGDDTIARGEDVVCSLTVDKGGQSFADLCLIPGGQGGQDEGLVCMTDSIGINVFCSYGWNLASQVIILTPDGAPYGMYVPLSGGDPIQVATLGGTPVFAVDVTGDVEGVNGFLAFAEESDLFTVGSNILASAATLYWLGIDIDGPKVDVFVEATVCMWYQNDPTAVNLQAGVFVTNRGSIFDEAPFNGEDDDGDAGTGITADDQRQDCPPSFLFVGVIDWPFGAFLPCESDRVVIFFPYLPKLVDTDFWTGISFVNQGAVNFDDDEVEAHLYEADGSRWDASFPALPVRNQQTYVLADDDQGVGFYDDDNGIFIPVEAQDGDLVPLDKRSSGFVLGSHIGTSVLDIANPDLDGFCLIGNTVTQVIYGYLPRNMQPGVGQIGDLPILQSKTDQTFSVEYKARRLDR
jgi:hypothetical protein